jgi:hypothetical protein
MVKRTQVSLMHTGNQVVFTGPVALYDIRGRLIANAVVPEGQRTDLKGLLGNRTDNLVVVRYRTK